ncbi:MAG: hypothetical protein ACK4FJ_18615 [Ferrovibrio sp.]
MSKVEKAAEAKAAVTEKVAPTVVAPALKPVAEKGPKKVTLPDGTVVVDN